jgi:hypothetical protein
VSAGASHFSCHVERERCNEMRSMSPGFPTSPSTSMGARSIDDPRWKAWPSGLRPLRWSFASLRMTATGKV